MSPLELPMCTFTLPDILNILSFYKDDSFTNNY